MQEQQDNHVALHVLNDYLKFEKKIYQVFGVPLGRPIAFKAVGYFLVIFIIEMAIYFTPIIGKVLHVFPFVILIAIPIGLAYLLADVQTEGRSSVAFFRSLISYARRKQKGVTYIRDRELPKPSTHQFKGYSVVTTTQSVKEKQRVKAIQIRQKKLARQKKK
ncbi:TcpE family protein [Ureibacillus xyleni]|uniref:TcpE family protein n=1 Tax=Ureibacillus xyleni TaxID=614648 RepID=A0A285TIH6_9BACL|nr:TcpE family conjugal transfer membrane protein [Ureibacillus xyleni]SOC21548.1 TcpE family protein [Ureibacillus xyleni]